MDYLIEYLTPDGVRKSATIPARDYTSAYLAAIYSLPLHTIILSITEA